MKKDILNSLAPGTQKNYLSRWKEFKNYYHTHYDEFHYSASKLHLALYITHLRYVKSAKSFSIRNHLSAITFYFNLKGITPPTTSFHAKSLLKSYERSDAKLLDVNIRLPITHNILISMIQIVPHISDSNYEALLLQSLYAIMYWSLLRVSEVTTSEDNAHNLLMSNISYDNQLNSLVIDFTSFKFSTSIIPIHLQIKDTLSCPVTLYQRYISHHPRKDGPVFVHSNGKPLSRNYVVKSIKLALQAISYDSSLFKTHSFRIGRATDMFLEGFSDYQIQLAGNWKSAAFRKYIKPRLIRL